MLNLINEHDNYHDGFLSEGFQLDNQRQDHFVGNEHLEVTMLNNLSSFYDSDIGVNSNDGSDPFSGISQHQNHHYDQTFTGNDIGHENHEGAALNNSASFQDDFIEANSIHLSNSLVDVFQHQNDNCEQPFRDNDTVRENHWVDGFQLDNQQQGYFVGHGNQEEISLNNPSSLHDNFIGVNPVNGNSPLADVFHSNDSYGQSILNNDFSLKDPLNLNLDNIHDRGIPTLADELSSHHMQASRSIQFGNGCDCNYSPSSCGAGPFCRWTY